MRKKNNSNLNDDMYTFMDGKYYLLKNVNYGTHTIKATNIYGVSIEKTFELENKCLDY